MLGYNSLDLEFLFAEGKMAKPTYNPSKIIRKRRHGFRARTLAGGHVLKARRAKGRARLSA